MTNYNDYTEWKEVEQLDGYTTSEYREYTPEDVLKICQDLIEKAEHEGLQGCYIRFNSEREPYEDYLAYPSITVVGYRPLTPGEKLEAVEDSRIEQLANELDTTIPNARAVYQLRKEGKL